MQLIEFDRLLLRNYCLSAYKYSFTKYMLTKLGSKDFTSFAYKRHFNLVRGKLWVALLQIVMHQVITFLIISLPHGALYEGPGICHIMCTVAQ